MVTRLHPQMNRLQTVMPMLMLSVLGFAACPFAGCAAPDGGYVTQTESGQDRQVALYLYPPASTGIPPQVVPLANIESDTDGIINLDPGVTVSGQLMVAFDDGGTSRTEPVSGQVTATVAGTNLSFEAQVNTDDATFELTVPQGRYDISVVPGDDARPVPPHYFQDVSISARNNGILTLPALDEGVSVEVIVSWPDETPLVGANVYTLDPENGYVTSVAIPGAENDEAAYWIQVARGEQTLWVGPSSSGVVPLYHLQIGELTVDDSVSALPPVSFTYPSWSYGVSGKTVNSVGQAVADVIVFATRQAKGQDGSYQAQTQTGTDGEFMLDLPEGTYELVFRPSASTDLSGARVSGLYVNEASEHWLGSVTLAERVDLELSVRGPEGSPVAGAAVTVQSDPNDRANPGTSTFTDEDGLCALTLGIGSYYVAVDPPEDTGLARKVSPVTVSPEMTALEDIRLEEGFSSTLTFLSGRDRVSGLVLQAWEALDDGTYTDSPVSLLATAISDENGQARLILPPP